MRIGQAPGWGNNRASCLEDVIASAAPLGVTGAPKFGLSRILIRSTWRPAGFSQKPQSRIKSKLAASCLGRASRYLHVSRQTLTRTAARRPPIVAGPLFRPNRLAWLLLRLAFDGRSLEIRRRCGRGFLRGDRFRRCCRGHRGFGGRRLGRRSGRSSGGWIRRTCRGSWCCRSCWLGLCLDDGGARSEHHCCSDQQHFG